MKTTPKKKTISETAKLQEVNKSSKINQMEN